MLICYSRPGCLMQVFSLCMIYLGYNNMIHWSKLYYIYSIIGFVCTIFEWLENFNFCQCNWSVCWGFFLFSFFDIRIKLRPLHLPGKCYRWATSMALSLWVNSYKFTQEDFSTTKQRGNFSEDLSAFITYWEE